MAENNRDMSFIFYASFIEMAERIKDDNIQLRFIKAIIKYGLDREIPDFSDIDNLGLLDAAFENVKGLIDNAKLKYQIQKDMQSLKCQLRLKTITQEIYQKRMQELKEMTKGL